MPTLGNDFEGGSSGQQLSQRTNGRIYQLKDKARVIGIAGRFKQNLDDLVDVQLCIYNVDNGYPTSLIYKSPKFNVKGDNFLWYALRTPETLELFPGNYFIAFHTYNTDLNKKIWLQYSVIPDDNRSFQLLDQNVEPSDPYPAGAFEWKTGPNSMVDPELFFVFAEQDF